MFLESEHGARERGGHKQASLRLDRSLEVLVIVSPRAFRSRLTPQRAVPDSDALS